MVFVPPSPPWPGACASPARGSAPWCLPTSRPSVAGRCGSGAHFPQKLQIQRSGAERIPQRCQAFVGQRSKRRLFRGFCCLSLTGPQALKFPSLHHRPVQKLHSPLLPKTPPVEQGAGYKVGRHYPCSAAAVVLSSSIEACLTVLSSEKEQKRCGKFGPVRQRCPPLALTCCKLHDSLSLQTSETGEFTHRLEVASRVSHLGMLRDCWVARGMQAGERAQDPPLAAWRIGHMDTRPTRLRSPRSGSILQSPVQLKPWPILAWRCRAKLRAVRACSWRS